MRALSMLVLFCLGVMAVLAYHAIRQELSVRDIKDRIEKATKQVRRDEDAIIQAKLKSQEINGILSSLNAKKAELTKKKQDISAAESQVLKNLEDCQFAKPVAESKMTTGYESLQNLKAQQVSDKAKAEQEVKDLKQQIVDKNKMICGFVDMTQEEGRKLCEVAEAPK
ncbi:hypothetical protein AAFF_G00427690 [Aldrovandia affinis]|uniref:Uncharacterized protein n=1 Tax=Aldrovandia affinis TaxID=143900 RepID=A0AAD7S9M6_9TELE|nr:hypothetical protein AAFF_G00427690 [Aldrovandia affinis]